MIVACTSDRAYVELTGVMLQSVVANANLPEVEFAVFGDNLSAHDEQLLKACVPDCRIQFFSLTTPLKGVRGIPMFHWPRSAFGKVFAPDLIARSSGRMLYLDSDVIVAQSIRELVDLPMDGSALAAAYTDRSAHDWLGLDSGYRHFNSGVLLFDLGAWRRLEGTRRTIEWAKQHAAVLRFPDNDALVGVFGNSFKILDSMYNYTGVNRQYLQLNEARIIHFTGTRKPDFADCPHPAVPMFLEHRQNTPWRDLPLKLPQQRRRPSVMQRLADRLTLLRHRISLD